jgi:hypothetical protein
MPDVQRAYLSACTEDETEAWFALLESESREDHMKAFDLAFEVFKRGLSEGD